MKKVALLSALALLTPQYAHAAYYIYSPKVEKGVMEIETKNALDYNDNSDDERQHKLAVGYGLTDWWALELSGEMEKESRHGYSYTATEVENIFQFTEPGQYWLDAGAKLEYEFNHETGGPDKIEAGLLLEKRLTKFTHTTNLTVVQEVGNNANENPEWEVAWRSLYLAHPMINPGFEYYGEFGEISHSGNYDSQTHHIGPVITGTLIPGLRYDLGLLFGISDSASDRAVKLNLEYEFPVQFY